jgi:hypothetical protein
MLGAAMLVTEPFEELVPACQVLRRIHPLMKYPNDIDELIVLLEEHNVRTDQHTSVTGTNMGSGPARLRA